MIRRLGLVLFTIALALAACGRQVTPNRTSPGGRGGGLAAGSMQVKFQTQGQMDFANVRYVIMFNTSGTGGEPYANGYQTNYQNYSFALVVGGSGNSVAQPVLYQYIHQTGPGGAVAIVPYRLYYTPQQLTFLPNSNGLGTEFSITFDRTLFYGISVTPSPSPTATASASASASPSPSPSSSPPAATPQPQPTTASQTTWYVNFFTTDTSGNPLDAFGIGGATDQSFVWSIDTTKIFDQQQFVGQNATQAPYASAQISIGEIANNP
ncbi:MAG: hypothetical protein ACYDDQ_02945 [Vulcanimicrobiaceae bacterium]